jgi:hypothetical protein
MAWHDRIQTVQQLRKRKWDKAQVCKFCEQEESVDHLLFQCPIAIATWCWIRDSLGWHGCPSSISSFQNFRVEGRGSREALRWVMAAVGWALWKTRNDLVFWALWKTRDDLLLSNTVINHLNKSLIRFWVS